MSHSQTCAALPHVTVVTVVRNDAAHIEATLQSVRALTYPLVEHIVLDGASTDGTVAIVERYRDGLAAFRSRPDRGLYDAMNEGIGLARPHSWVHFLNAGDVFASPHSLDLFKQLSGRPRLILAPVIRRAERDTLIPACARRRIGLPASHQGFFCRQDLLDSLRFDTRYTLAADFDLYTRIARRVASGDIMVTRDPVAIISAGGVSDRKATEVTRQYCLILWRARQWGPLLLYASKRSLRHGLERLAGRQAHNYVP